jgi:hypothetical protein
MMPRRFPVRWQLRIDLLVDTDKRADTRLSGALFRCVPTDFRVLCGLLREIYLGVA